MKNWCIILMMIGLLCMEVGKNTLVKAATRKGMSNFVFIVYANSLGLIFLIPLTFIFHKIKPIPPISFSIISRIFLLALCSVGVQISTYVGIGYSSPTLNSAISNLTPAFTFLLALLTRMEKLEMKSISSQAKLIGTIVAIAGAFVINFYKGPQIISHLLSTTTSNDHLLLLTQSNWILGGFLGALSAFLTSLLFIIQAWIMKDYTSEVMVTLVGCIFVTIQSTLVALILEKHQNVWKIAVDLELATIFYTAILEVLLRSIIVTWAIRLKGPVFITLFMPLGMVIAVVMGVPFLGDDLYIGSVIGAVIIAVGFYSVMWGKANESKAIDYNQNDDEVSSYNSSFSKSPLLRA